ncbi:LANO_0C06964g1_1 [Lachancea nothofagi CBS 11611]|uniref:Palmitoyltransferase n=1 Tax=Lachancea nothofagi CBS 11611 TaxID=1266666 RepID=A0A1G4J8T9_9SACH|nr:LANO_0C06964g1_1 [Lachancea nothofagi CBS 11611]
MSVYVWCFIIPQLVFLLFSPLLRSKPIFRWYYRAVFHPIFVDVNRFRWKFRTIPVFYLSVFLYCSALFFKDIERPIRSELYFLERWIVIPLAIVTPLLLGVLTMAIRPLTSRDCQATEPFDNLIFHPGLTCQTCKLPKYARSKHCAICNQCTLMADHHCVWANNCIGLGNYQYFYLFLVANVFVTSYGFLRLLLLKGSFRSRSVLVLSILLGCFSVILVIFTYFQVALVRDGMTSSEESKWLVVHDMLNQGNLVVDQAGKYYYKVERDDPETLLYPKRFDYYSTNAYDDRVYNVQSPMTVQDARQLTNIYDRDGFWANLSARIKA